MGSELYSSLVEEEKQKKMANDISKLGQIITLALH